LTTVTRVGSGVAEHDALPRSSQEAPHETREPTSDGVRAFIAFITSLQRDRVPAV